MKRWLRPAVFGAADGLTCALAAVLSLAGHPGLVLHTAIALSVAECVSMAAGEWLSDSDSGLAASVVIGVATGAGGVLPAIPYAWLSGAAAMTVSVLVFAVAAGAIAWARCGERGRWRAVAETYGVLAVAAAAVVLSVLITPRG